MNLKRWLRPNIILFLTLLLVLSYNPKAKILYLSGSAEGFEVVQKQTPRSRKNITVPPKQTPQNNKKAVKSVKFNLPPVGGQGSRTDAATRSDLCAVDGKPLLTALIPGTNYGLTISERPTFWFYLPYEPNIKTPVRFELKNEQNKVVYENSFQLIATPGIVGITLPSKAQALKVAKSYVWTLSFSCNPKSQVEIRSVSGTVERVELPSTVKPELDRAKGRDRFLFYAARGWWYETLTELIEMRRKNPQDAQLIKDWQELLKQTPEIQLDILINEPVVPCCQSMK